MRKKNGFTLIEILTVIVILGILAGIAIPAVFKYVKKTRKEAYTIMQTTIYNGARNYVIKESRTLPLCSTGFADIESEQRLLEKLQYVDKLTDPADKSKQCFYKVYGCQESLPSANTLPTYKYKVQIDCIDYRNCAVYRDDGTILPCDEATEQTEGPKCGAYTSTNNSWKNIASVDVSLTCVDNTTGKCAQRQYTQTFTSETKSSNIIIKDIFGNTTTCPVNVYIDRTAPSKPVIENPYENKWTNKSYSIKIKSVDNTSGIKYFEYRYPNSSKTEERQWKQWANSSKKPKDNTPFTTTNFSAERNEAVEVRACDYAGNCSQSSQSIIKIDKTKPTCTISKNPPSPNGPNSWYISNVSLSLNTADEGGSTVGSYDLTTSTSPSYKGIKTATQTTTAGVTYYGYVKDTAGNTNACNSGNIKVDTGTPSTPVITNSNSTKWVNSNYNVSVSTRSGVSGLAHIQYSLDNANWTTISGSSASANANKTISFTFDKEGSYTYYFRACNNVGKCSSSASTKSYIDKTPPAAPTLNNPKNNIWAEISYVNANSYVIEVTSSDAHSGIAYYQYRYPSSQPGWTTYANSAKNSFTTTAFTAERNENVEIRACDNAKNCSSGTKSMIKIDKTKPTCSLSITSGTKNSSGKYTTNVTVSLNKSDALSGLAGYGMSTSNSVNYSGQTSLSATSNGSYTYYGFVKDNAGNTNSCSTSFTISKYYCSSGTLTYDSSKGYICIKKGSSKEGLTGSYTPVSCGGGCATASDGICGPPQEGCTSGLCWCPNYGTTYYCDSGWSKYDGNESSLRCYRAASSG